MQFTKRDITHVREQHVIILSQQEYDTFQKMLNERIGHESELKAIRLKSNQAEVEFQIEIAKQ